MKRKKKSDKPTWGSYTPTQRREVASYLRDRADEMEIDRESLEEEHGFDFVAAIEALADEVTLAAESGGFHDLIAAARAVVAGGWTHGEDCAHRYCENDCDGEDCEAPGELCDCGMREIDQLRDALDGVEK